MMTWCLKGPNWESCISTNESLDASEAASRCLEKKQKQESPHSRRDLNFDLGIILELSHSDMKSELDHFVISTPLILANCGFYNEASYLDRLISNYNAYE
jgi:hypothetical protein